MKLLEPIKVGNITFKNRIMFPPLTTGYEEKDGSIGEQSFRFYERLAKGGVGYILKQNFGISLPEKMRELSLLHQSFTHPNRQKASSALLMHVMCMVQSLESSYSIQTTMSLH